MAEETVLILDENATSRTFIANHFRGKQFKTLEAGSGKEALIIAWRDEPGLILFEPVLSDISDIEFVQKLRQNSRTNDTPIIALSSDTGSTRKEALVNAGVNEYLFKSAQAMDALDESLVSLFGTERPIAPPKPVVDNRKVDGLLVVFLSAKGGTGTSSLCANFAMNIKRAEPESSMVVADLVLPIGSIAPMVGYEGELNLF